MKIIDMRKTLNLSQSEFGKKFNIPYRTIQNWELEIRKPPEYVITLLENNIKNEVYYKKNIIIPPYDSKKKDLPKRSDYIGSFTWLKEVQKCLGNDIVFALDEALICEGMFNGKFNEYIIWVYGDESLSLFNNVVVLGNNISKYQIKEKDGIKYTNFNRTLNDSFSNENILDMQGITEALSYYYYTNGESFEGITVAPEFQYDFETLAKDAIEYYNED